MQKARIAGAGLVVACVLIASAWMFGRDAEFKPWLVAAVVVIVLVRRAIPHGIAINGNAWSAGFVVVGGWLACAWLRSRFNLEISEKEYGEPPMVVTGALFFLGGAVYAFGRAVYDAVGQLRQLRVA